MLELLNCRSMAERLLDDLEQQVIKLKEKTGVQPRLDVILVGNNPASEVYVNNKVKRAMRVGIYSRTHRLPESITEEELIQLIKALNDISSVHGIMVQLPLPNHIDSDRIIETIDWKKDVDGLTSVNQAKLLNNQSPRLDPCTPLAVLHILKESGVELEGRDVTVLGRSRLFGKPMALLLQNHNATVTMCHSKSKLRYPLLTSDVVISAIGQPKHLKGTQFGCNQTLIDVGINRDENGKLCGDIDLDSFKGVVGHWKATPVPNGVGQLTTTLLMSNTIKACLIQNEKN